MHISKRCAGRSRRFGTVACLLLHHQIVEHGVLRGEYLETDYASFAAWQHWGRPPAGVRDCFGAAAILTADGAFLLGVMGPHTFNAGEIYFPCGTPDPDDIIDGKVDLDLSVRRELKEETGLDIAEFEVEPGWTTVVDGPLIAADQGVAFERECQCPVWAYTRASRVRTVFGACRYSHGPRGHRYRPGHATLYYGIPGVAICRRIE